MKKNQFTIVILAIIALTASKLSAQQVVASSGGTGQSTSGTITYTLGELVIDTYNGTDKKLTQGFQQSRLVITAINEIKGLSYTVNAFPNPTTDFIKIRLEKDFPESINYLMLDMNGKVISSGKIANGETDISFEAVSPGTYFIKFVQDQKEIKTTKVVKQ